MPPRKTKRRGRQLVDDVTDGAAPAAEPVSAEYLDTVLSELDRDVEARCKMIKRETEDAQQQLALEFKTLLFCLPKHIREMPMSQFANEFGGRVDEVVKKTVAAQMRKLPPRTEVKLAPCAGTSAQATARGAGAVSATPHEKPPSTARTTRATARRGGAPQATPAPTLGRAAMAGEGMYSVRGSPLNVRNGAPTTIKATVKSKHCTAAAAAAAAAPEPAASLVIELPTGNVDLSEPGAVQAINEAAPEAKQDVLAKLGALLGLVSSVRDQL